MKTDDGLSTAMEWVDGLHHGWLLVAIVMVGVFSQTPLQPLLPALLPGEQAKGEIGPSWCMWGGEEGVAWLPVENHLGRDKGRRQVCKLKLLNGTCLKNYCNT